MAESFGIPQVVDYLHTMGLRIAKVDSNQEIIELAFHGNHGQWRMLVAFQQNNEVRKLMFIIPHISTITVKKRLECLEALLAVNYRIAMGKFGMDLDDGEVRLEESVPLGRGVITREQFQLVLGAMIQTVAMYHSLIPRIIYSNMTTRQALQACEQEFLKGNEENQQDSTAEESSENHAGEETDNLPELRLDDVLAEVTRIFEEDKE